MISRAREKSIWGEDVPSPLKQFYLKNFTYQLESQHYYDRPYPISSSAFKDIPLIGPLLAATVGRVIKPSVLMHQEEFMGEGGIYKLPPSEAVAKPGEAPVAGFGGLSPQKPISPYGTKGVIGEQAYRMSEMVGLPGFVMTAIKERLTGTQDLFDKEMQLASADAIAETGRGYWDMDVGGMLSLNEAFRRLYPHERRQIEKYNPLLNQMPSWLPGPGEKGRRNILLWSIFPANDPRPAFGCPGTN